MKKFFFLPALLFASLISYAKESDTTLQSATILPVTRLEDSSLVKNYFASIIANSSSTKSSSKLFKEPDYHYNTSGSKIWYNGFAINSNFVLPGLRFNFLKTSQQTNANTKGSLEYFNSVGAGVGVSWGRITIKHKDGNTKIDDNTDPDNIDINMKNIIGLNFGFLFSKNNVDSLNRQIFAPTISLQLLDFQFGVGWELGDVGQKYSNTFFTVAYSIPLQKLTDVGSYLLTGYKPKDITTKRSSLF